MKYLPKFLLLSALFSPLVQAACDDREVMCRLITQGAAKDVSCEAAICSNMDSTFISWKSAEGTVLEDTYFTESGKSETTLDKAAAYRLPNDILKDGMRCFGTAKLEKIFCANNPPE